MTTRERSPRPRPSPRLARHDSTEFREAQERLAKNVRRLRTEARWTQEEAAFRCEMPVRLYVSVEHGESNATLGTLTRLSKGLGVDVAELLRVKR